MGDVWAQYLRCATSCKGRGEYVALGHTGTVPEGPSKYMMSINEHIARGAFVHERVAQGVTSCLCIHEAACKGNTRQMRGKRRPGLHTIEEGELEGPARGIEPCMARGYRAVKGCKGKDNRKLLAINGRQRLPCL